MHGQELLGGMADVAQRLAHGGQVDLTFLGQQQATVETPEELDPQALLQVLDLVADRGLGDVQFLRGPGKAEVAAGGLEELQGLEGGQGVHSRIRKFWANR